MTSRLADRWLALMLVALAAGGLAACGQDAPQGPSAPSVATLLDGGQRGFEERIAALVGTPVVVNQWASWCGPCRFEFPFFRSQAEQREGSVAFLGVNSRDSRKDAAAFLETQPLPFPQLFDPDATIARLFRGGRAWPTTAYYDARGKLNFTHQGAYATEADLAEDIERYAVDG